MRFLHKRKFIQTTSFLTAFVMIMTISIAAYAMTQENNESDTTWDAPLPKVKTIQEPEPVKEPEQTEYTDYTYTPWEEFNITETDWLLLTGMAYAEAGNQPDEGIKAVISVALNRKDDPDFPDTIEKVITQKNQFTTYKNGSIDSEIQEGIPKNIETIAKQELKSKSYPSLYYFSATNYHEYGKPWDTIGDHYFNTK